MATSVSFTFTFTGTDPSGASRSFSGSTEGMDMSRRSRQYCIEFEIDWRFIYFWRHGDITPAVHMSLLLWIWHRSGVSLSEPENNIRRGREELRLRLPGRHRRSKGSEAKKSSHTHSRSHALARSRAIRSSFSMDSLNSTTIRLISKRTSMQMSAMMIFSRNAPWSVSYISRMTVAISWA